MTPPSPLRPIPNGHLCSTICPYLHGQGSDDPRCAGFTCPPESLNFGGGGERRILRSSSCLGLPAESHHLEA